MISIHEFKTAKEAGVSAAALVADVVRHTPDAVLGLATGSSPLDMYAELIRLYREGSLSFAGVRTVNLDEYVGLAPTHDQSYAYFMHHNLFDHIDVHPENTNLPSGLAADPAAECARYDAVVSSFGRLDLQVLGIGNNGHIGFNEPSDSFSKGTGLVHLTASTIDANARFFASRAEVPTAALTMGIGQILSAERILLLAFGEKKAAILKEALYGPVTPQVPASILQFARQVDVFADEAAMQVIHG